MLYFSCAHLGSNQGPKDYESFFGNHLTMRQIIVSDLQRPIYGLFLKSQNLDCGIIVPAIGNKPGSFGLGKKIHVKWR
jgi:hypothetical protein